MVLVRDREHDGRAEAAARKLARTAALFGEGGPLQVRHVRTVRARFTFSELSAWRDAAFDHVLGIVPNAVTLDLDEEHNRVAIGIDAEGAAAAAAQNQARQTLRQLGVPPEALRFYRSGRHVNDVMDPPNSILDDSNDPLAGGLQIVVGGSSGCTMGFAAMRDGVAGLVSASHCTSLMFNPDGDAVSQVFRSAGNESVDPNAYTCGVRRCRGADAAFFSSNGNLEMGVGLIARTTFKNNGDLNGGLGSTVFDQQNPYWFITSTENDNLYLGQHVQKVGVTTGWTWGWITQTCIDHWVTGNSVMRCAYEASYVADHGDSGGPVFVIADFPAGRVILAGIHSGRDFWSNRPRFGKTSRIRSDLGGFWNIVHPNPPQPSPIPFQMYLAYSGGFDQMISEPGDYTFTPIVSGAVGAVSYAWSVRYYEEFIDHGTDPTLTLSFMCPQYYDWVTVRVTVSDSNGSTATDEKSFAVNTQQSPSCQTR